MSYHQVVQLQVPKHWFPPVLELLDLFHLDPTKVDKYIIYIPSNQHKKYANHYHIITETYQQIISTVSWYQWRKFSLLFLRLCFLFICRFFLLNFFSCFSPFWFFLLWFFFLRWFIIFLILLMFNGILLINLSFWSSDIYSHYFIIHVILRLFTYT